MANTVRHAALFFALTLAACSKAGVENGADAESMDGSVAHDAGVPDAGSSVRDTGAGVDGAASMDDAGPQSPIDAGPCLTMCDTQHGDNDCSGCGVISSCVASPNQRFGMCTASCPQQCDTSRGTADCAHCRGATNCVANDYPAGTRFGTCQP